MNFKNFLPILVVGGGEVSELNVKLDKEESPPYFFYLFQIE